MDLKEILELVEKAEAGSRELDARMHAALHGGMFMSLDRKERDGFDVDYVTFFASGCHTTSYDFPAYTTSLDAIVGLVEKEFPERGHIQLKSDTGYHAWITPSEDDTPRVYRSAPLALCAAYLRAKLAQGE